MNLQNGLKAHSPEYTHQKCFVGHSHKAPWHDDIISVCEETLPKFGLQPWYADDQFEPTKSLRDKVVEMIANARYGLYDLSWWRPDEQSAWKMPQNVLIELGMAIALNRPVLLLRHAENRASGLSLPACLDSINQRIVEFSGGPTLKHALEERLPQWLDVPPERAWWARYCLFGERVCTYRESYPQIIQCGQKTIGCHIADGKDIDRPDFRSLIEDELGRYSDISFDYLDALLPTAGYDFQLCMCCQIVRSTPFAIYRITPETTADTFIAIGMSIALEKQFKCEIPKFIFTTDARSVPSLLAGYEVVEAKTTKERQKCLRKFIPVVMRKVRESVWKPEPLPFVEFSPQPSEISLPQKEQPLFSEDAEEHELSNGEVHIDENELSQDTDNAEVDDANELALKQFEEDIRLYPNNAGIYNDKGEAAAALRRYEEALNDYNKAIELEADNPAFYFNRGRVHLAMKKYEQALEDFDKAVVLNPGYPDARRQRDMVWNMLSSSLNMPFHEKLKRERERCGLSQAELAEKIGIDPKTINRWETGRTLPQPFYRRRLAEIFGTSLVELGLIENNSDQSQEDIKSRESNENAQNHSRGNYQLRHAREERGWTQEELADMLGITGVTISRWERGKQFPTSYYLRELCRIFNTTAAELGLLYDINQEEEEKRYCERVINQLTSRQEQVLEAFAGGLLPSEVAELLSISPHTVATHTTVLLSLCRETWSIKEGERIDYRFLQLKFGLYLRNSDAVSLLPPQDASPEVLIELYKAVQDGKITDPATIRSIAASFEMIAQDSEAKNRVSFDAERAAQILYTWAQKNDALYNMDHEDETEPL